jgi:hypothetical protein
VPVPQDIRESRPRFGDSWAQCSYEAKLPGGEFDLQVLAAARKVFSSGPPPELIGEDDEKPWVAVNSEYRLVYFWTAEYDHGRPVSYHLNLLLVERS